jgi:hypothetical protein
MKFIRFSWTALAVLVMLTALTACHGKDPTPENSGSPGPTEQNRQDVLSYDQYVKLVASIKDKLLFSSIPMKLTESTLENPSIIIVNGDMSFGKKEYLSLNNDLKDSTQYFLTYEDAKNGYKLITGWIFTDVNQGNNLLYFKPNVEGNTGDFNSILSYKNILIHLQLTHTASSSPSSEDFVKENEAALKDIVSFLESSR